MARGSIQTREWLTQRPIHFERVTLLCISFLSESLPSMRGSWQPRSCFRHMGEPSFLEKETLQDTFGHIPTSSSAEFTHSHLRPLCQWGVPSNPHRRLDRVLVVARKLMLRISLLSTSRRLLGFGELLLALRSTVSRFTHHPRPPACAVRVARATSGRQPGSPAAPDGTHFGRPIADANGTQPQSRAVAKGFMSLDIAAPPEDVATCCIDPW